MTVNLMTTLKVCSTRTAATDLGLTVHMMQYRLPWRNVVSWRKLRHQSTPRRQGRLELAAGSRADCRICYRYPSTFCFWYARLAENPIPVYPERAYAQIFAELGPMDLVNLARTSKALRQVLMSRKSMSVWIVARRNATITKAPDPPEDMSEPAWALLLFGPAVCSVRCQAPSHIASISS